MLPLDRHFGLISPSAAKFSLATDKNRAWVSIDKKLRQIVLSEPGAIVFDQLHHMGGLAVDRNHSRPRQRRSAVFTRAGKGPAVNLHLLLVELADDRVRQHAFDKHVLLQNHFLADLRSETLKHAP